MSFKQKNLYNNRCSHLILPAVSLSHSNLWNIFCFLCCRPFACHLCSAKFTQNLFLKRHLVVHVNEYLFTCSICERKFKRKHDRDIHVASHSQIRKYNCPHCDQYFMREPGLRNHIGIHTGEHPFKCGLCPQEFKFSASSSVHRRTHMVDGQYRCQLCDYQQKSFKMFKAHLKSCAPSFLFPCTNNTEPFMDEWIIIFRSCSFIKWKLFRHYILNGCL